MKKLQVHGALVLVSLIYGANYSIAKIATPEYVGPFGFIVIRVVITTGLFWLLAFFSKREPIQHKRDYLLFFRCAIFGVAINQLMFFKGISLTSPIHGSLIMTTVPFIVLVVSYFLLKEKITRNRIIGLLIGASGAIALILSEGVSVGNDIFVGDLFILLNAGSYSIYLVLVRPLMMRYQATTIIRWIFLFGVPMVTPFGIHQVFIVEWAQLPPEVWWSIAFVVIGTTFLAYSLNAWSLKFVSSTVVGMYIYLQPVFATIIAIMMAQDTLDLNKIFFTILIFSGVYLVSKKD